MTQHPNPKHGKWPEQEPLPQAIQQATQGILNANSWMALALHLPLRFEDHNTPTAPGELAPGQKVNIWGTVTAIQQRNKPKPSLLVWIANDTLQLQLRWLHIYPGQASKFTEGLQLMATGVLRPLNVAKNGRTQPAQHPALQTYEIIHPQVQLHAKQPTSGDVSIFITTPQAPSHANLNETSTQNTANTSPNTTTGLKPIYPSGNGIRQSDWTRWMKKLPNSCFEDTLSPEQCQTYKLMPWDTCLRILHGNAHVDELPSLNSRQHPAWQRVMVDELLAQQLQLFQLQSIRQQSLAQPMPYLPGPNPLQQQLLAQLPFQLTQAQKRVIHEIISDLQHPAPMHRLLQGDVGSGKTLVALMVALHAIAHGHQVALVAPTEVLAQQHFNKLTPWVLPLNIHIAMLTGSSKIKHKRTTLAGLERGEIQLVVGTHALLQDKVKFKSLSLVIFDEQHRFGVAQRLSGLQKATGQLVAHQLMMSATPIPRTLAQTHYADLAISTIDEKPPGRQSIITKLMSQNKRTSLIAALDDELNMGRQAYWVCPLIEESETLDLQAAQDALTELQGLLPHRQVGLLHGRQSAAEKIETMHQFVTGSIHVLVSTTVIEVGVDVPNATLMVIDHAQRFGLAQLHQLRGRVGRGMHQSLCVLLYGTPLSNIAKARLKAMHESDDGFYLAEQDLKIRGPGELLGKRQSGMPLLRYADPIVQKELLETAKALAKELTQPDANFEHIRLRHIERWLGETPWWQS